jgi:hypothetical protein
LHILHWLKSQDQPYPWDSVRVEKAARSRDHNSEVLQWLNEQGMSTRGQSELEEVYTAASPTPPTTANCVTS